MRLPQNSNKPYTVRDDNDLVAIGRAYGFYWRANPLWLLNMPGQDNKALRAEYRARRADLALVQGTGEQQAAEAA